MDGDAEFAKTMPSANTRYRGESWRGARKEDTTNINIIKLEPEGAEHIGMVSRAAEDG